MKRKIKGKWASIKQNIIFNIFLNKYIRDLSIAFFGAMLGVFIALRGQDNLNKQYEKQHYGSLLSASLLESEHNIGMLNNRIEYILHHQSSISIYDAAKDSTKSFYYSTECIKLLYNSAITYKYASKTFKNALPFMYSKNTIYSVLINEEYLTFDIEYIKSIITYLMNSKVLIENEGIIILGNEYWNSILN